MEHTKQLEEKRRDHMANQLLCSAATIGATMPGALYRLMRCEAVKSSPEQQTLLTNLRTIMKVPGEITGTNNA